MSIKPKLLFLFFIIFLSYQVYGAEFDISLCGPKSLQIVLKSRGIVSSLKELNDLTHYDPPKGTTMMGLYEAAQAKKVEVAAVRIGMKELCKTQDNKITFVDGNHFLVVCGCDKDKIFIEDPFTGKYSQKKEDFQKRWNGETLLFGQEARTLLATSKPTPVLRSPGPKIQFDKILQDFGTVEEGSLLTYSFLFRNTGSDTLDVMARSTCGCTVALLSDKKIPPDGIGKVRMEFKTQDRKGPTSQSINVRTNDPNNQMLTLTMRAIVRGSIKVIPDRLWFDNILSGSKMKREVIVVDSGDGKLAIDNVLVPNGISANVLPSRKDKSGLRVIPISLSVSVDSLGQFERVITIYTNDPRRKEIPLFISGTTLARVKAFPPRIFFGEVKPDSITKRELIISSTNGKKIEGLRVKSGSPLVNIDLIPLENGTKYKVIASLTALKNGTTVLDSISVYLANSVFPVIGIPLYAKVVQ